MENQLDRSTISSNVAKEHIGGTTVPTVKIKNEDTISKALKQKLTKAERRAIQESQRMIKLENRKSKGLPRKPVASQNVEKKVSIIVNEQECDTKESLQNTLDSLKLSENELELNSRKPSILENESNLMITTDTEATNEQSNTTIKNLPDDLIQIEKSVRARKHMDDPRTHKRMNKKLNRQNIPIRVETTRKMVIFSHLKQYDKPYVIEQNFNILSSKIGYDFIVLGLQYSEGTILGSNARSISLLIAIRNFIINYKTPSDKVLSRDMEISLRPAISFLNQCRSLAIGMGNIIKFVKYNITSLSYTLSEEENKELLLAKLENFYQTRIINAHNIVVNVIQSKINDNDTILTYACSSLVSDILVEAINRKKRIRLVIVDSKPRFEGKKLLNKFSKIGIECIYTNINGISYVMKRVTKVLLGAHGLLANGAVMTRVGSAMVTTVANAFNIPVLVCCESYKFSEKAQTDAIVYNELCDPNELITSTPNAPFHFNNWKDANSVCMLNLSYDVILPKFISALVTELGIVPCTSAPIVIRMKNLY